MDNSMTTNNVIDGFLLLYSGQVHCNALLLREIILKNLPEVQEQLNIPAKMIAYS